MLESLVKVGRRCLILHRLKYGAHCSCYLASTVSGFHRVHVRHTCTHLPDFIQQLVNWLVSDLYGLCTAELFAESEMSAWKNVLVPFALLFL